MNKRNLRIIKTFMVLLIFLSGCSKNHFSKDERMQWWRQARFGMFVHWGLYSIPAGEWGDKNGYAEWIRHSAQIPVDVYDEFREKFNPVKFNADEWVKAAKDAGMKYIVITTKHHDGFCLFDSKYTDFDVMSTPYRKDIMKDIAAACTKYGIRLGWYYSIMDWHHPDYLPRRGWEKNRSSDNADFNRYIKYMKNQLSELLTNYGHVDILWFDGEWEETWNRKRGEDLLKYVRKISPETIVNNRVGAGRTGMEDTGTDENLTGDFGTPEQYIPATGIPGADWETCMTMNDHWGYNKSDKNWKTTKDLIRKLVDISSKGGNFLLNVGPKSNGTFPEQAVERLKGIRRWMSLNSESIYGTMANPFNKFDWGTCTWKKEGENSKLYFHVFNWPEDNRLFINRVFNEPVRAYVLSDKTHENLNIVWNHGSIMIELPKKIPDVIDTVIVLELKGDPDIVYAPEIEPGYFIFVDSLKVTLSTKNNNCKILYTINGENPDLNSLEYKGPFFIDKTSVIRARSFRNNKSQGVVVKKRFSKVEPLKAVDVKNIKRGVKYYLYKGKWDRMPDFSGLTVRDSGVLDKISLKKSEDKDNFGYVFECLVKIPQTGVYGMSVVSDDGSRLYVDNELVVDNDGLHGPEKKRGWVALEKGYHKIKTE